MQVIENFLSKSFENYLEKNIIENNYFPWYYNETTSLYDKNDKINRSFITKNVKDNPQFTHTFFSYKLNEMSNFYHLVYPIIYYISDYLKCDYTNKIFRIKANMLLKNESFSQDCFHLPHTDAPYIDSEHSEELTKWTSVIYYVNDSDGDTFFFEEILDERKNNLWNQQLPKEPKIQVRVGPQKGKAVIFNSNQYHASSSPTTNSKRCVLNFVLFER